MSHGLVRIKPNHALRDDFPDPMPLVEIRDEGPAPYTGGVWYFTEYDGIKWRWREDDLEPVDQDPEEAQVNPEPDMPVLRETLTTPTVFDEELQEIVAELPVPTINGVPGPWPIHVQRMPPRDPEDPALHYTHPLPMVRGIEDRPRPNFTRKEIEEDTAPTLIVPSGRSMPSVLDEVPTDVPTPDVVIAVGDRVWIKETVEEGIWGRAPFRVTQRNGSLLKLDGWLNFDVDEVEPVPTDDGLPRPDHG